MRCNHLCEGEETSFKVGDELAEEASFCSKDSISCSNSLILSCNNRVGDLKESYSHADFVGKRMHVPQTGLTESHFYISRGCQEPRSDARLKQFTCLRLRQFRQDVFLWKRFNRSPREDVVGAGDMANFVGRRQSKHKGAFKRKVVANGGGHRCYLLTDR